MEVTAKILPIEKRAVDNSFFPRNVLVEYLESEQYKYRMATRTCLGGITHANRDPKGNKYDLIPSVDMMLLNMIITHYVSEMWIDRDWLWGRITVLPLEPFEGTQIAHWIKMLRGLLASGIELPVSAVVIGEWKNDICQKIKDIPGVDITLDPGFEKAGVILRDKTKQFSRRTNFR